MAEEKRKRKLGFETSAGIIESEFDALFNTLTTGSANWSKMVDQSSQSLKDTQAALIEARKSKNSEGVALILGLQRFLLLSQFIGQLGVHLTLIHKNIAECEKGIKELKLCTG